MDNDVEQMYNEIEQREQIELKKKRHQYYMENKEYLNEKARKRYKEKRSDPEFYRTMLKKNNEFYHRKTEVAPLTPEEEELFFKRVVSNIKHINEIDKEKQRPQKPIKFHVLMNMFTD